MTGVTPFDGQRGTKRGKSRTRRHVRLKPIVVTSSQLGKDSKWEVRDKVHRSSYSTYTSAPHQACPCATTHRTKLPPPPVAPSRQKVNLLTSSFLDFDGIDSETKCKTRRPEKKLRDLSDK
ncbi:hypothetical protein QAD02_019979 [Eretmocerus hayati]|uniref:Uncharacterized protein n=1 Tax=Eretmocerus hayati TaxID=131215 RepID=A0ACC2PLC7_9HYME|nr:hypothetical protein QAD02_019979 [Eretmocerus hayati]